MRYYFVISFRLLTTTLLLISIPLLMLNNVTFYIDGSTDIKNKTDVTLFVHLAMSYNDNPNDIRINRVGSYEPHWTEIKPNESISVESHLDNDPGQVVGLFIKNNNGKTGLMKLTTPGQRAIIITSADLTIPFFTEISQDLGLKDTLEKRSFKTEALELFRWFSPLIIMHLVVFILFILSFKMKLRKISNA